MSWSQDDPLWTAPADNGNDVVALNWGLFPGTATTWDSKRSNFQVHVASDTVITVARLVIKLYVAWVSAYPGQSIGTSIGLNTNQLFVANPINLPNQPPLTEAGELDATVDVFSFLDKTGGDNNFEWTGAAGAAAAGSNSFIALTATLHMEGTGTKPTTSGGTEPFDFGPIWNAIKPFVPFIVLGGLGLFALQVFTPQIAQTIRGFQGLTGGPPASQYGYGPPSQPAPIIIQTR